MIHLVAIKARQGLRKNYLMYGCDCPLQMLLAIGRL